MTLFKKEKSLVSWQVWAFAELSVNEGGIPLSSNPQTLGMQSVYRLIYGVSPEEKVKNWQRHLRREQRVLDREIKQLDAATYKAQGQLKQLASKGDTKSARILAKEVVRTNKQKNRLHTSKARLGSIDVQLGHQLAMIKVTGTLQKSTEIMKLSNSLVKLPQISQTMREMSMEMTKAGIIEEMIDDTIQVDDDEELEEEADAEVEKVLFEVTGGKLGQIGVVGAELPPITNETEEEERKQMEEYREQLNGLLSG